MRPNVLSLHIDYDDQKSGLALPPERTIAIFLWRFATTSEPTVRDGRGSKCIVFLGTVITA
jgi:hypothetical protein